jgi:hypothetical protein
MANNSLNKLSAVPGINTNKKRKKKQYSDYSEVLILN